MDDECCVGDFFLDRSYVQHKFRFGDFRQEVDALTAASVGAEWFVHG
jgi:pterin-4a-carbinolamine dehydratase